MTASTYIASIRPRRTELKALINLRRDAWSAKMNALSLCMESLTL